jgi:hypothetical protein
LIDSTKIPLWDPTCLKSREIQKINDESEIYYLQFSANASLVSDRSFIVKKVKGKVGDKLVINVGSIDDKFADKQALSDCYYTVRGRILWGGFVITPIDDNSCTMDFMGLIDPSGWIPVFVINWKTKDAPMCLKNVKKLIENSK